jgi:hypothetical protein
MVTLEGAESEIETILAEEPHVAENDNDGTKNGAASIEAPRPASLADRIRALQNRSSRTVPAT